MFRTAFRRLLAIDDPPERTALAFSVGVSIGFSPLLGLHTILATLIAFIFRFNKIAIYTGTFISNPFFTLGPIIAASYAIGAFVLGRPVRIPSQGIALLKSPHLLTADYYHNVFGQSWHVVEPFCHWRYGAFSGLFGYFISDNIMGAARTSQKARRTFLKIIVIGGTILLSGVWGYSQTKPSPSPSPSRPSPVPQRPATSFELSDYGVAIQAEPRLVIVMAALEAAGFDPTPAGREPSVFRAQVVRDFADLDPALRDRMRTFYGRNSLPAPATAADQAARYVSLAFALGAPPALDAPERSEELPAGVLEVLDFAPLVREFYRRAGLDEQLVSYMRAYQAEGDRLRQPTAEMVRALLSYLHTRPITITLERVVTKAPTGGKKKIAPKTYTAREHERRFLIVPDLLAAPGVVNFRVIGDDYYAVVPARTDPTSSELRRAYLQYVIDPLILRYNREIAARREQIKQLLAEREKAGGSTSPDIFLTVSKSLVAAADARFDELRRLGALASDTRIRLARAKDDTSRSTIGKEGQAAMIAIQDEAIARLADEYERGAVLDFYFADQLRGIESSGFDIANFFVDMISSFDPARESRRLTEVAEVLRRATAARQARLSRKADPEPPVYTDAEAAKFAGLVKKLAEVEEILRLKDYKTAETRLKALLPEYPREPRIFFSLAQTASLAAADATDEDVQAQRLNDALSNYRLTVKAASPETDRGLLSRAHEAMGRIYAFQDNPSEASKEFDEAIRIGDVRGGAYQGAVEGKKKLAQPR